MLPVVALLSPADPRLEHPARDDAGDAVHATLPYLAQGAAMAIEDGAVLTRALGMSDDIGEALDLYERNRAERTAKSSAARMQTARCSTCPTRISFGKLSPIATKASRATIGCTATIQ